MYTDTHIHTLSTDPELKIDTSRPKLHPYPYYPTTQAKGVVGRSVYETVSEKYPDDLVLLPRFCSSNTSAHCFIP